MITMASVVIYGLTLNESVGFFTQMKPWRGGWGPALSRTRLAIGGAVCSLDRTRHGARDNI